MIEKLTRLVDDIGTRQSKLILVVGGPRSSKTALVRLLGQYREVAPLAVGSALARRLATLPQRQRHLQATAILRELTDRNGVNDLLLLDNIELLFDRTLQLDPLGILKQHAHARRVVAVWPGQLRNGRLIYAEMGHPEHQDYGIEALIPFVIE